MSSCETGNNGSKEDLMPRKRKYDRKNTCIRCKDAPGKLVIRHSVYCKECFFPMVMLKFRKVLEPLVNPPHKPRVRIKQNLEAAGDLLLGFSGGVGSSILLDMIWRIYVEDWNEIPGSNDKGGTMKPHRPPVWKKIRVAYVETCATRDGTDDRTSEVQALVDRYPTFEFIPLKLEDAFDSSWWEKYGPDDPNKPPTNSLAVNLATSALDISSSLESTSPKDALRTHLNYLPTSTATHHTIGTLIRLLLQYYSLAVGSSHLLLGSSLTSLSIALISCISQGGGFSVKEEREEIWNGLKVIRPLRDVGVKECAAWLWWRRLKIAAHRDSLHGAKEARSIQYLTRDFIVGLERDFPSTVSTITRTCEKLEPKGGSKGICKMCQRPVQAGLEEWKAQISIKSRPAVGPPDETPASTAPSLTTHICYSCHTTLTSRSSRTRGGLGGTIDAVPLAVWVNGGKDLQPEAWTKTRVTEGGMKNRLEGFLLEE